MKIHLEDITDEGLQLSFDEAQDLLSKALADAPPLDGVLIEPTVKGEMDLIKTGDDFSLSGIVHAVMRLRCARCLREFSTGKSIEMDLLLRPRNAEAQTEDDSVETAENEISIQGPDIDLAEIIYQEILLEVPMKPLCSDACPGLCPMCGALKGSDQCKCPGETATDPRWEALARLREKMPP